MYSQLLAIRILLIYYTYLGCLAKVLTLKGDIRNNTNIVARTGVASHETQPDQAKRTRALVRSALNSLFGSLVWG